MSCNMVVFFFFFLGGGGGGGGGWFENSNLPFEVCSHVEVLVDNAFVPIL
jgi:hypothetical protein